MLRENSNNWHFQIFLSAMFFVLPSKEKERKYREEQIDTVIELASHFPRGEFSWVSLWIKVISSSMEPVPVTIHMVQIILSELVKGIVFQVVVFYFKIRFMDFYTYLFSHLQLVLLHLRIFFGLIFLLIHKVLGRGLLLKILMLVIYW